MILSVHIPKTAGTSFQAEIQAGKLGRHLFDYGDRIYSRYPRQIAKRVRSHVAARWRREELEERYDVIHGHYSARKYLGLFREERLVAFFRDPVELTISFYDYWRTQPAELFRNHSWYDRTVGRGASLMEFARTPEMRGFYDRILGGVPFSRFFFVGIVERYDESLEALRRLLGVGIGERRLNVRPSGDKSRPTGEELAELREINRRNYVLYREALDRNREILAAVRRERVRAAHRGKAEASSPGTMRSAFL